MQLSWDQQTCRIQIGGQFMYFSEAVCFICLWFCLAFIRRECFHVTNPVKKLYMPILSFLSGFEKLLRWNKRMAGKPIGYLLVFARIYWLCGDWTTTINSQRGTEQLFHSFEGTFDTLYFRRLCFGNGVFCDWDKQLHEWSNSNFIK